MKEHRTKALRVTTPHSIENNNASNKDEYINRDNANDLFGSLQILQFELVPSRSDSPPSQNTPAPDKFCVQSSSSRYSQSRSEIMTTHTATLTANPVFGKHDSFYRWFSSEFDNDNKHCQLASGTKDVTDDNLEQSSKTCHCRSTFHERKTKHNKSVSGCSIHRSLALIHSDDSYSVLDLVSGDLSGNWFLKLRDIKEAISRERASSTKQWCTLKDINGNTALLVSGQKLLKEGFFEKAVELVKMLIEEGADVNVINDENRTLLSYSVQYMDRSIRLTTLLINYGATVWPIPADPELPVCSNEKFTGNTCNSAFTWFLRCIIRQLRLSDHCLQTLYLLAEVMGENPVQMHSHVMSTMFNHARCYSILGPVFLQIKLAMSPYWTQPQSLKFLCKSAIRKSVISVPGRFVNAENMSSLMLPPSLQSYLMLEY